MAKQDQAEHSKNRTDKKMFAYKILSLQKLEENSAAGNEGSPYLEERILAAGHYETEQQNPNVFTKALVQSQESKK